VAPWSAYAILPVFAFSAAGVAITIDFSSPGSARIFAGVLLALVAGKPLGIVLASALGVASGVGVAPADVSRRQFLGAACLCGVADTVALLMADRAFGPAEAAVAKLAVLAGSAIAGLAGLLVLRSASANETQARS
jgi:NhaA family Na+:H+ antiporter